MGAYVMRASAIDTFTTAYGCVKASILGFYPFSQIVSDGARRVDLEWNIKTEPSSPGKHERNCHGQK
jgi:hypothetical protein